MENETPLIKKENSQYESSEKKNTYLEYALFLVLGFLLGIVLKTEASKRVTIGYEDFQLDTKKQTYNINQLEKTLMDKAKKEQEAQQNNQPGGNNAPADGGSENGR